ncbi:hypothetical protein GDO81_011511 [Engystomops pustulosus]|uniref:Transposase Tc1-like domain-containing protein n=1 Tax=Engystomops pustulosus TaxID=76066 RepID=A0AAV7BES9_ENGPU|nr:hypothetical protein GDO81_011511 [Engystomops pustulosus]
MGYSSRRPHRVPLLSAKNRKLRLQFAQAHRNWTVEDWKNQVMRHVIKLESSQTGFLNMTMRSLYSNGLQSPDLNPIEHLWDWWVEREIRIMDVQPTNASSTLLNHATKN